MSVRYLSKAAVFLFSLYMGTLSAAPPDNGGEEGPVSQSEAILQRLKVNEAVTAHTTELLGERIDLSTGAITFSHTDVVIPGPAGLDIVISRSWRGGRRQLHSMSMGDWELELPRIQTYAVRTRGIGLQFSTSWGQGEACSGEFYPSPVRSDGTSNSRVIYPQEYFNGVDLIVPGRGVEKLLTIADGHRTRSNWRLRCFTNDDGREGFIGQSPDGLEYTFDVETSRAGHTIKSDFVPVPIYNLYMYVSKIRDRFGNEIHYQYLSDKIRITATDGRVVTINYNADDVISSIETSQGTWIYGYTKDSYGRSKLTAATLPDGSAWALDLASAAYGAGSLAQPGLICEPINVTYQARLTHPNGTRGTFTIRPTYHGRTNARKPGLGEPGTTHCFVVGSLSGKVLEVPGSGTFTWAYNYSKNQGSARESSLIAEAPQGVTVRPDLDPRDVKTTSVVAPDGSKTVYHFLRRWDAKEGHRVSTEYYDTNGTMLLRRQDSYAEQGTCIGAIGVLWENMAPHTCGTKLIKEVITDYKGSASTTFITEYSQFNQYDTPTLSKEYNSINPAWVKYTRESYAHHNANSSRYLLINVPVKTEVSANGQSWTTVAENTYFSATGSKPFLPHEKKRFGSWLSRNTDYHASGDLKKTEFNAPMTGGGNRWLELPAYKFGQPTAFKLPGPQVGATPLQASRVIGSDAWIDSVTDFEGVTTGYDHDAMGRLSLIDHPGSWSDLLFSFAPVSSSDRSDLGIAAAQYERTMTQDQFVRTRFFDGLLRPVLERKKDTGKGTTYYRNRTFDAFGNVTFESYWSKSPGESQGVRRVYDGLRRLLSTERTADAAKTTRDYLTNNRVKTTDPRGHVTTVSHKAYGWPDQSMPVSIVAPEGVTTTMGYNLFGNLESVAQGGHTERRYYDTNQNICRIVRPEFGDTVFFHTPAGELAWEARGLGLSGSGCQHGAVAETQKIRHVYDDLGRLRQTLYPDSTPDLTFDYTKNGLLQLLDTGDGANWTYDYNALGLLEAEMLQVDGQTFTVDYTYDGNGALKDLQYPSGRRVRFAPDAFGRPTQAGGYAHTVSYHPNGMLSQFTYGNGMTHSTQLNSIQLPRQRRDRNRSNAIYDQSAFYDKALNITSLADGIDGHYDLGMTYDGLDRLDGVSGPWGAGDIDYDALGNIRRMALGSFQLNYSYDARNRLATVAGTKGYSFGYDNRGNVTANGNRGFSYNLANQMIASGANGYRYDGHGKRVKVTGAEGTVYAYYNRSGQLLYKYDTGGTASDYIYLGKQLVAKDMTGPSASAPAGAPALTVPAQVGLNEVVTASWTAVTNATFYLLQRQGVSGHWAAVYNMDETASAVMPTQGYNNFRVAACNAAGCGPFSSVKTSFAPPAAPPSIGLPSGTSVDGNFTVHWGSSWGAVSYVVQEQKNSGSWTQVASQSGTSKGLSGRGNGSYRYRVQACNSAGCSGWRISASLNVLHPPGVPGSLTVPTSTDTDGAFTVSWASVPTATTYTLREERNGASYTTVATQSGTSKR